MRLSIEACLYLFSIFGSTRPDQPGVVELEFFSKECLEYANVFYFTPVDQDNVVLTSVISAKQRMFPIWFLLWIAGPVLKRSLYQDMWILDLQNKGKNKYKDRKQIVMDTDIVRKQLEIFLSGGDQRVEFSHMKAML